MNLTQNILKVLQSILPNHGEKIALHEPQFRGNEWKYIKECLDTGWVSSVGKYVDTFEEKLSEFTGAKHAVVTVNGTAAMHIAYLLAGVMPGDEVLVPTLTFVGTINPIHYCGAIPHFIESEEKHLGIDIALLDDYLKDILTKQNGISVNKFTGRPVRVLCVMHTLGHSVDLDALIALCEEYRLTLIEDAAEAMGSYYKGTHVGHKGLVGVLSFNGNKIITTGGGGAILTNHLELAKRAKHITTTAKLPHAWEFQHDEMGFNYRMPNINAALGYAQLENIQNFLTAKRQLAEKYQAAFSKNNYVKMIQEPEYGKSNYWLNALVLDKSCASQKENVLNELLNNNIQVRPLWNLQHTLPMYQACPKMPLQVAESLFSRVIKIPSSAALGSVETCNA